MHRARPALGYAQVLAGAALFGLAAIVSKMSLTAGIAPARLERAALHRCRARAAALPRADPAVAAADLTA